MGWQLGSRTVPSTMVAISHTWLVWIELCCNYKVYTSFQNLGKKKQNVYFIDTCYID